jgi:cobaltochelatase CobN
MHRIAATPGGWNPDFEGVIFIEQTPAPIVLLTAADTDIQSIAVAVTHLPAQFPQLRVVNLLQLQQQLSIDSYAETILSQAKVIVLRLLGGKSYWSYGLEVVKEIAAANGAFLFILPGDDRPDPSLMSHSTVCLTAVNQLWRYFLEGGIENWLNGLKFMGDFCLGTSFNPPPPQVVPRLGLYAWNYSKSSSDLAGFPSVGLLFYRAHYLAGNTKPIDALCQALVQRNLQPIPLFVSSLRDPDVQEELLDYFQPPKVEGIHLLLNTTSFAIAQLGLRDNNYSDTSSRSRFLNLWESLNIPVFQVILSGGTEEQWEGNFQGLNPRDVAMNVALPEVDGRIITRAVSFKSIQTWNPALETDVIAYQPRQDRINFVADLAANWLRLKQTPIGERKIALILANYPNRDGRIGNGVGLDTPESCLEILKALQQHGYFLQDIPETGDQLIKYLTSGITNDPEGEGMRPVYQKLSLEEYQTYFKTLPESIKTAINQRWGEVGARGKINQSFFPIAGIQLGNIFIGIQPSRGYDRDPSLTYHAPDLEPTHDYLAYYYWLREKFNALAIIHLGKHGNLEWLPGKSIALAQTCYPEIALQSLPNFYPFIVNDPGEGAQAKRRSHAVILDHLTPPLTRAELYGDLAKLETLIDEYYEAQTLDPSRLKTISERIDKLLQQSHLNKDLKIEPIQATSRAEFLTQVDSYLCQLKEAQIRDGLHIFGKCPQGNQLRDIILAIARFPTLNNLGITQAIAQDLNLDFNPLTANPTDTFSLPHEDSRGDGSREQGEGFEVTNSPNYPVNIQRPLTSFAPLHLGAKPNISDAITLLEQQASQLIETLLQNPQTKIQNPFGSATQKQLEWIQKFLLPSLQKTEQEITYLLQGLDGQYVPSGAAGAPTRGRPDVLPTGRNFYSVDIRAIPTETAWEIGRKAAEALIERYTQENGEYPQTLAISIWGTSTMRTGGDDIAQVLALLGVKPVWDGSSRRVVGYEILTPSALGRPRVDVTVRVSGFFRDGFPNLLQLLYNIINEVSSLKEEKDINPLAEQVKIDAQFWQKQGLEKAQAKERACYRIFGSKPGAYGAGLQGLIEAQNWKNDEDLALAYLNWSSYAYKVSAVNSGEIKGVSAPEAFQQRLQQLQIVLHNQDNREHDLLDSDDYYQFQGGLTAAVRALTGRNPHTYFGDNSMPTNPKVRLLREEISRVYRSRVVNPKWIAGVMRHGYKGAFEMAATVDYLFAYDATARCVEDYMYQGVAEAYLFDAQVQAFIQEKNPWALRDMAERLLEANQRGLWESVDQETLEKLREIVNYAEGIIEIMN